MGNPLLHLKVATRTLHERLEHSSPFKTLLDASMSKHDYHSALRINESLLHAVISQIDHCAPILSRNIVNLASPEAESASADLEALRKHLEALLIQVSTDLSGSSIRSLPDHKFGAMPSERDALSCLLGWLYVVVGSGLGGKIIHRALGQHAKPETLGSQAYYQSLADGALENWHSLQSLASSLNGTGLICPERCSQAARGCFEFALALCEHPLLWAG